MTREERRQILGDSVIEEIHARVAEAPEATAELIDVLRRVLTHPAGRAIAPEPSEQQTAA